MNYLESAVPVVKIRKHSENWSGATGAVYECFLRKKTEHIEDKE